MKTTAFVEKARKRTMSKFQFVTCMVIICMLSGWLIGMAAWMAVLRYQRGPLESLPMFFVTVSCAALLMIGISLGAVTGSHWIKAEAAPERQKGEG